MPSYVTSYLEVDDLSRGLDTLDPATRVPKGYYVDAQNMVMSTKSPQTIGGLTKLTLSPAPLNEIVLWAEPYTVGTTTSLIVATSGGVLYKYDTTADTWTTLLLGLSTTAEVYTHVPFRGTLVLSNGVDPIYKYDGTNVLPVGGNLVASMETTETWGGIFTRPTSNRRDWRREGNSSIRINSGDDAKVTYAAAKDFKVGLNGAPDFGTTDVLKVWVYRETGTAVGKIRFRFEDKTTPTTKYFERTETITHTGWSQISVTIKNLVATGAAVWTNIGTFRIYVDSGQYFFFDQAFFQYLLSPPVGGLLELYAQQLVVAGISSDPVAIKYSDPGSIDYFAVENVARFSGGRNALEKKDQITALRSYFDELIVGKVNSAWTFSGTGTNVSISALPLTIGIDAHRAIAETPWSLQYLFENNIFGARLTSRGLVSSNVNSLLEELNGDQLDKCGVIRHDRSHTLRWTFRTNAASGANDLGLIYDYQLDAWTSRYTPAVRYYTRGIVNGNREILVVQYDGYVRRADVGVDFDGTPIESYVTLPYLQSQGEGKHTTVTRWIDGTFYVRGTAAVLVQARFADDPHTFDTAVFKTYGTIKATPDGDKGYVQFGQTARWMQLRLRATALAFEVLLPLAIGYSDTSRRV